MSTIIVAPSYELLFVFGAIFTCFVGSHASLCLAAASIRLRKKRITLLTGLVFSIQCIFALHFVGMCGIDLGVLWGFDIIFTVASVTVVAIFGTAAIAVALSLRAALEPHLQENLPSQGKPPSLAQYRLLVQLLFTRVPYPKLLLISALMATATAGCHHLGMWSMRGTGDVILTSELTLWSLLWTVGLGGIVSVLAVLTFAIVPEGLSVWPASILLTAGIAGFHFASTSYGMRFVIGAPGLATNFPMGKDFVFILIILQSSLSQMVSSFISKYAVDQYNEAQHELRLADKLGQYIAKMELDKARACNSEQLEESALKNVMGLIIDNLELYRPFLPDTLFSMTDEREVPRPEEPVCTGTVSADQEFQAVPDITVNTSFMTDDGALSRASDSARRLTMRREKPTAASAKFATGLRRSQISLLRIRLLMEAQGGRRAPNYAHIEKLITRFMSVVVMEVKGHGGTVVFCAGGQALGMWRTYSPDTAISCAFAIRGSELPLVQVVQHSTFFVGNLAAHQSRSFNIVGPDEWLGQQLLRLTVSQGPSPIFVTDREKAVVALKNPCLPFELVRTDGDPMTVYIVQPPSRRESGPDWIYHDPGPKSAQLCANLLQTCWRSYTRGNYAHAKELLRSLTGVPDWYSHHLQTLVSHAALHSPTVPAKCIDSLGSFASQVEDVLLPGHPM